MPACCSVGCMKYITGWERSAECCSVCVGGGSTIMIAADVRMVCSQKEKGAFAC
jgi:hypothetical protein